MVTHVMNERKTSPHMAQELGHFLANTYVLYLKTQNFHWNVVDSRFASLHHLFEKQYEELAEAVDLIAERIRALGKEAPATMRQFLELTSLEETQGSFSGDQMLHCLYDDHQTISNELHQLIENALNVDDQGTADLFIERLRAHEKAMWMLKSHFSRN